MLLCFYQSKLRGQRELNLAIVKPKCSRKQRFESDWFARYENYISNKAIKASRENIRLFDQIILNILFPKLLLNFSL